MKYDVRVRGMWAFFKGSFKKNLPVITSENPQLIMKKAHEKYHEIISEVPDFDKDDRFAVNIISCAMLAAIYLNLHEKPSLEAMTEYYRKSMTDSSVMRLLLRLNDHYSEKAQAKLARQAEESLTRTNPYTWKFRYEAGKSINSYTAYFDTCGILKLAKKLGIEEIVPAMCNFDYDIARLGGSVFTREYTLAGGGPYCDCHYRKKDNSK